MTITSSKKLRTLRLNLLLAGLFILLNGCSVETSDEVQATYFERIQWPSQERVIGEEPVDEADAAGMNCWHFAYDYGGRVVRADYMAMGTLRNHPEYTIATIRMQYKNGNLTAVGTFGEDGKLKEIYGGRGPAQSVWEYDETGNKTKRWYYDAKGNVVFMQQY